MDKSSKLHVVEYREGDRVVRLFLRRRQDPAPNPPTDIRSLSCELADAVMYRVRFFLSDGRRQDHEYPLHEVARCEDEWPPKKN